LFDMKVEKAVQGPGRESVWDYPRLPHLEAYSKRIRVIFNGVTIADTTRAKRELETSHPPVCYIPREDIRMEHLRVATGTSFCEWKGRAEYFDLVVGTRTEPRVAWSYPNPTPAFAGIRGHLAFYAAPMDACYVDDERVTPPPGGFYGGWITRDIVGPFKGEPGTSGW